jgi:hypothetical protein
MAQSTGARPAVGKIILLGLVLTAAAGPAWSASPFDGTYVGTQRETLNNNSGQCANINRDNARLAVKDGVISYRWAVPIETTVGSDGSFSVDQQGQQVGRGGTNQLSFKGKITGGQLEAEVGSARCAAHLSLKKT